MSKPFVIGLLLLLFLAGCVNNGGQEKVDKACFKDKCYALELAETAEQREKGLSGRSSLDEGIGMLFIYPDEEIRAFWMKDMLIPLDIIWIGGDGTVVFISKNNEPCGREYCPFIYPDKKARYVLEINGGETDKTNLSVGSKLVLS